MPYRFSEKPTNYLKSLSKGDLASFYFTTDARGATAGLVVAKTTDLGSDKSKALGVAMRKELKTKKFCRGVVLSNGVKVVFVVLGGNTKSAELEKILRKKMATSGEDSVSKIAPLLKKMDSFPKAWLTDAPLERQIAFGLAAPPVEGDTSSGTSSSTTEPPAPLSGLSFDALKKQLAGAEDFSEAAFAEEQAEVIEEARREYRDVVSTDTSKMTEEELDAHEERRDQALWNLGQAVDIGPKLFDLDATEDEGIEDLAELSDTLLRSGKHQEMFALDNTTVDELVKETGVELVVQPFVSGLLELEGGTILPRPFPYAGTFCTVLCTDTYTDGARYNGATVSACASADLKPLIELNQQISDQIVAVYQDLKRSGFVTPSLVAAVDIGGIIGGSSGSFSAKELIERKETLMGTVITGGYEKLKAQVTRLSTSGDSLVMEPTVYSYFEHLVSQIDRQLTLLSAARDVAVDISTETLPDPRLPDVTPDPVAVQLKQDHLKALLAAQSTGFARIQAGGQERELGFTFYWSSDPSAPSFIAAAGWSPSDLGAFNDALNAFEYHNVTGTAFWVGTLCCFSLVSSEQAPAVRMALKHKKAAPIFMPDGLDDVSKPSGLTDGMRKKSRRAAMSRAHNAMKEQEQERLQSRLKELKEGARSAEAARAGTTDDQNPPRNPTSSTIELLKDPYYSDAFIQLVQSLYADESLMYLVAVRPDLAFLEPRFAPLSRIASSSGVERAKLICEQFVIRSAPDQININSADRVYLQQRYDDRIASEKARETDPSAPLLGLTGHVVSEFSPATTAIRKLLDGDTLPRFPQWLADL